jgi:LacI family transcriptional regulator
LSVVGVDNIAEASHFWPPLTTVYQPLVDVGAQAVKEIDRLIRTERQSRRTQEPTPEMTLLMPELIVRDSTRPVSSPSAASHMAEPANGAQQPATVHGR